LSYLPKAFSRNQDIVELSKKLPITHPNQKHVGITCNVSDVKSVNEAVKQAESIFGHVDILINAAGVGDH
jgi:NAD(P)-dependent dehydrogenase (short-subunit alcohol dehydrogenase family)